VDDRPVVSLAVERDVDELGWTVVPAATSDEVVRRFRDRNLRFAAALVELRLDRVNTTALLGLLADEHPGVRRIVMSGETSAEELQTLLESGLAHAFVQKPWQRQAFIAALAPLA